MVRLNITHYDNLMSIHKTKTNFRFAQRQEKLHKANVKLKFILTSF
jgi:hypothetical protein